MMTPGCASRSCFTSSPENSSCTSHAPGQVRMRIPVCAATFFARYWSGTMITVSVFHSLAICSTTCAALELVQVMWHSAFTSAVQFT